MVDLGTGSGAIGLSVAMERVGTMVAMAVDISSDALAVARANLAGHGRRRAHVRVVHGEWFEALDHLISDEPPMAAHFSAPDLILANPPYVAYGSKLDRGVFEWEPHLALFADEEGLSALHAIIDGAGERLSGRRAAGQSARRRGRRAGSRRAMGGRGQAWCRLSRAPTFPGRSPRVSAVTPESACNP